MSTGGGRFLLFFKSTKRVQQIVAHTNNVSISKNLAPCPSAGLPNQGALFGDRPFFLFRLGFRGNSTFWRLNFLPALDAHVHIQLPSSEFLVSVVDPRIRLESPLSPETANVCSWCVAHFKRTARVRSATLNDLTKKKHEPWSKYATAF